jgi:hypothetical protein
MPTEIRWFVRTSLACLLCVAALWPRIRGLAPKPAAAGPAETRSP